MTSRSNSQFVVASVTEFLSVWAHGGKASLNLSTSDGFVTVGFNCTLGHPGAPHSIPAFSHPPSPPTFPTPSPPPPHPPRRPRHRGPSERERNRLRAARHQAARVEATAPDISASSATASVVSAASAQSTDTRTDSSPASTASVSKRVLVAKTSDPEEEPDIAVNLVSSIDFKCDQCDYCNISEKGLAQHKRMKHRISQVDGSIDFDEETKDEVTFPVQEEEPVVLKINRFGLPEVTELHPDVTPPARVSSPDMGIGCNPVKAMFLHRTYWEYTFSKLGFPEEKEQRRIYYIHYPD